MRLMLVPASKISYAIPFRLSRMKVTRGVSLSRHSPKLTPPFKNANRYAKRPKFVSFCQKPPYFLKRSASAVSI